MAVEEQKKSKYKVTVTDTEKTPEEEARHKEMVTNLLYDMKLRSMERQKAQKIQSENR